MDKRKFDYVIFDMDGTLVDSFVPHNRFCIDMAKRFRIPKIYPGSEDLDAWGKLLRRGFANFFKKEGYSEEQVKEVFRIYRAEFSNTPRYRVDFYPGMKDFVKKLSSIGCSLSVVSHNVRNNVFPIINRAGVVFNPVYCREDLDANYSGGKARAIAKIKRASNHVANVVYVGDTIGDYRDSVRAGVCFEGVSWGRGFQDIEEGISISRTLSELESKLVS